MIAELDARLPARAVARRGARDPLRRQPRQQPLAVLQHQRDEHHREQLPAGVPQRAAKPGHQRGERASGFRATTGCPVRCALPIFEAAFGPRGSQAGARRHCRLHTMPRSSRTCSRARRAGWRTRSPGPLPTRSSTRAGLSATACRAAHHAGTTRRALTRSTSSRRTRLRRAHEPAAARSTDEASSEYDALQLQYPSALPQRSVDDGELHVRQGAYRPLLDQRGLRRMTTSTLRDKSLEWGPTGYDLRHIFQVYGTYDLPFGDGRRYDIQNGVAGTGSRRLGTLGDRPDADRQTVPAAERTADPQPE